MVEEDRVYWEDSDCIVFIFFLFLLEEDMRGVDRFFFFVLFIE